MPTQTTRPGEAIRTLRHLAGLTLEQTSTLAETAPAYLSKVETGKLTPTRGYVANIVRAISVQMQLSDAQLLNERVSA